MFSTHVDKIAIQNYSSLVDIMLHTHIQIYYVVIKIQTRNLKIKFRNSYPKFLKVKFIYFKILSSLGLYFVFLHRLKIHCAITSNFLMNSKNP